VVVEAADAVGGSNPQTSDFVDPQIEAAIKQLNFQISQLASN
jgi:hypothetical protein